MDLSVEMPIELRTRYLQRRAEDVLKLRLALRSRDLKAFTEVGSQVAGTAPNYGFPQLEKIATNLMNAGTQQQLGEANRSLEDFANCILLLSEECRNQLPLSNQQ